MSAEPLSAAQRGRIRRLSAPREPSASDEGGELNVVPYLDIIMNVMMFVLVTVSVAFASSINTAAASPFPGPAPLAGLHLTALITSQGVALKTAGGALAPGCEALGAGITVPNHDGGYDLGALTACARHIKGLREAAHERQVSVTASPNVPYEVVISVMDALRADETGELFPEVSLGAVR
jgi:biopolymer transport protein ExbD